MPVVHRTTTHCFWIANIGTGVSVEHVWLAPSFIYNYATTAPQSLTAVMALMAPKVSEHDAIDR